MPLLSGFKSAIAALDNLCDFERLEPEIARVHKEIAELAAFCKAFNLDQGAQLDVAAMALGGS